MSIVLIILLLSSFMVVNGATTANSMIQMSMDGRMVNFRPVKLSINNQLIQSDVPPVIHDDRTLVPLRVIIENIKADVVWNDATKEVTVTKDGQIIVLKINEGVARVNGQSVNLPDGVPPKLIDNRTMVPIRFVAENLGLGVEWNSGTQTVMLTYAPPVQESVRASAINVISNGYYPEVRIKTGKEVQFKESFLSNPTRLIIDLQNVRFDLEDKRNLLADGSYRLAVSNSLAKAVRVSQNNSQTRVVLELEQTVPHKVHYDQASGEMVISFANNVSNVRVEQQNMKEVVVIEGGNVSNYNVLRLNNPERLVVDIMDANLSGSNYQLDVNGKVAKSVRVSQFDAAQFYTPDDQVVRIVIDLQTKDKYEEFHVDVKNNQLTVHLEGKPYERLSYEATSWTTSRLTLRGNTTTQYQVRRIPNTNTLEILVPKNAIDFEFSNLAVNDHLIKNVIIDTNGNNSNYKLLIHLENEVEHRVVSSLNTKDLVLEIRNTNKYREVLVVIDPGHGGNDPGAISPRLKIKESDIVLDVSQRLNKLLLEAGFRTYMTRTGNTTISLQDRVAVANQLNGDIFVSVHANSATNHSAEGIENYYFATSTNGRDAALNKRLAEIFQDEMIKETGARSRGAKAQNFHVIRETRMPAVLSEIGFLSNQREESLMNSPEYRQKIAVSMFNAIVKYFEETKFK